MLFGFCRWLPCVAVNNGTVGAPLEFESHDGFDAGANCSGSAFVGSAFDEFVEFGEERFGKSYGDLFGGHPLSIPPRDAKRYAEAGSSQTVPKRCVLVLNGLSIDFVVMRSGHRSLVVIEIVHKATQRLLGRTNLRCG